MGTGKKVSEAVGGSLVDTIWEQFTQTRTIPPLTAKGFVRGSAFASLCPREEVLAAIHGVVRTEDLDANSLVNFALGTGIHVALQEEILPAIGVILGEWSCLTCARHYGGMDGKPGFDLELMVARPKQCPKCEGTTFKYVEQFFRNEEYRITGHPDGFLKVPGREGIGLLEAKSIGAGGAWEIKKVPKFEHVIQAQIYMWFADLPWACVLYWDKSKYGADAFVEHFVDRDEDTIEAVKTVLKSIWDGIASGTLPPRICATQKAPRAISCACAKPCFATEE